MKLLIAEKPSVATGAYRELLERVEGERFSKCDGYLQGRGHVISWCVGHLVGLASPEAYGWGWKMEDLPLIPQKWKYEIIPKTKKQFNILKDLIVKADEIIAGADAGREGQLITDLVIMMAGCGKKPQKRLWVNAFDFSTLSEAWKNMKPSSEYRRLSQSAVARARSDWMVGMTGTIGYSVITGQRGLSVGRVQTPTLRLVVDRDFEVENFKEKFYYQLIGEWNKLKFTYHDDGETKFDKEERLKQVLDVCTGKPAELKELERNTRKKNPKKPFDLTELQKEANRKFSFKVAKTLELTQKLYEQKLVSYPRTDSQYLPETMKDDVFKIIETVVSDKERTVLRGQDEKFVCFNSKKVSDHYAIIPTGNKLPDSVSEDEANIYGLIRERFILAFCKPYVFDEYSLELVCEGHGFKSKATLEIDKGFMAVKAPGKNEEKKVKDEENAGNKLNGPLNFGVGETAPFYSLEVIKRKAAKPSYYNEGTLLTAMGTAGRVIDDEEMREAMKERGLGTSATKASIIEALKKRQYIEAKGKSLKSTQKGRALIGFVDERLKSPEMTGEWEYKLNQIASGNYDIKVFGGEIKEYVTSLTQSLKKGTAEKFLQEMTAGSPDCPKCKTNKVILNPKIVKCPDEKCGFILWPRVAGKKLSSKNISDLLTKGKTGVIKGFKSKAGKKFDAALGMGDDFKVEFKF